MISDTSVGVAVIGTGRAGMVHATNYAKKLPNAYLAALVDIDREKLESASHEVEAAHCYTDYLKALADPEVDAVVIATPTIYHHRIACDAARAGKHVFCEKPMAITVEQCEEMIEAAADARVKLQVGFMRRFDKNYISAKEAVLAGDIGDVVLVKSLTRGPSVPKEWMYDLKKSNGVLAEVNSHDIDTLRWFSGSEFSEVYAVAGNYRLRDKASLYPDFYDNIILTARLANGTQGLIDGAASVSYAYDARTEIVGTKGAIFIGDVQEGSLVVCSAEKGVAGQAVKSWRTLFADAYVKEAASFVEAIFTDKQPRVSGMDGLLAVAVANAGNESIREGKPVRVPQAIRSTV